MDVFTFSLHVYRVVLKQIPRFILG